MSALARTPSSGSCTTEALFQTYMEMKESGAEMTNLAEKSWWTQCPSAVRKEVYERILGTQQEDLSVEEFVRNALVRIGALQRRYGASSVTACNRIANERSGVQSRQERESDSAALAALGEALRMINADYGHFCSAGRQVITSCPAHAHKSPSRRTTCTCDAGYKLNSTRTKCVPKYGLEERRVRADWLNRLRARPARRLIRRTAREGR